MRHLVNIHQKVFVPTGQQFLSRLLNNISKQTGLSFNLQKNIVLVYNAKKTDCTNGLPTALAVPVKGVVTDAEGKPMVGATVSVKGTNTSVLTDKDGNFSVAASDDAVLIITFVGYKDQEISRKRPAQVKRSVEETTKPWVKWSL